MALASKIFNILRGRLHAGAKSTGKATDARAQGPYHIASAADDADKIKSKVNLDKDRTHTQTQLLTLIKWAGRSHQLIRVIMARISFEPLPDMLSVSTFLKPPPALGGQCKVTS